MSCSTEGSKDPSDLFKSCVGKYTDTIDLNQYASFRTKIKQLMENAILLDLKEVVVHLFVNEERQVSRRL